MERYNDDELELADRWMISYTPIHELTSRLPNRQNNIDGLHQSFIYIYITYSGCDTF